MTGATDTRIVNMQINNKQFLSGAGESLKALDTLNKGIDNAGKGKGMQEMGKGVDTVKTKFGALQIAGVAALGTLVSKAVSAGLQMAKSLTIGPLIGGFKEYEKLLTSTQTIMANTGLKGSEGFKVASKYLDELNSYSDETIYNFGQMADNIGKFTAAGVKLPAATLAIKGLANSAALAGSDTNQLNTAMYQMSQALASGTIKLMDWNSLVNAGMGGKNMQNTLKATAMTIDGVSGKMQQAIKAGGSFRDSLRSGWLTADVFSKAMKVMAGQTLGATTSMKKFNELGISDANAKLLKAGGAAKFTAGEIKKLSEQGFDKAAIDSLEMGKSVAYTVKQLREMGYSKEAAQRLHDISQASIDSATKVKTFGQLMQVVKESIESGWAGVFRQIFGDLPESIAMWTKVKDVVTGAIDKIFKSAISLLSVWHNMEDAQTGMNGFQMFWASIGNIFKSIGNLLRPFVMLLGALIPNANNGGEALFGMTKVFYNFTVWLEKATSNTSALNPVLKVLGAIIGAVATSVWELIKLLLPAATAIGNMVLSLVDLVSQFVDLEGFQGKMSGLFDQFIDAREAILSPLVNTVKDLADAFRTLMEGGDWGAFGQNIRNAFANLGDFKGLFKQGYNAAKDMIAGIKSGLGGGDWQATVQGWVDNFVNFFKGLLGINSPSTVFAEIGRNIVEGLVNGLEAAGGLIKDAFNGLMNMDRYDFVGVISGIFGGTMLFTILRFVKTLNDGFKSVFGVVDRLLGPNGTLGQVNKTMQSLQTGIKAKALLNIALAIGVLAVSLWILSKIPHDRLVTGMIAITIMMYQMIGVMKAMAANAATTKTAIASIMAMAFAFTLFAIATLLLAGAIAAFGNMDTGTLIKGILAVTAVMGILAGASYVLGLAAPTMILAAAGVLILSVALAALAPVILMYSKMEWDTIWSGMLKMALALGILGAAMILLSAQGPNLLVASVALVVLSVALASLLGVIKLFAETEWSTIISGIAKIAAVLLVLGVVAMIVGPALVVLGAAALLFGAALLLAGAGMVLFGAGLALVAAAGAAAFAVLLAGIEMFLAALPLFMVQLVMALNTLLKALAAKAPEIVDSLVKIVTEFLRGISEIAPKVADTVLDIIQAFLDAVVENQEMLFDAGFDLIQGFLDALNERVPELVQTGIDIITKLMEGIGNNAEQLTTAAGKMILDLMQAFRIAVETYMPQIVAEGRKIAWAIITGVAEGLIPEPIRNALQGLVDGVVNFFRDLLGINSPSTVFKGFGSDIVNGLRDGIRNKIGDAVNAIQTLGSRIIGNIKEIPGKAKNALGNLGGMLKERFSNAFQTAKDAVKNKIDDIVQAVKELPGKIRDKISDLKSAAKGLGKSIIDGIGQGVKSGASWAANLGGQLKGVVNKGLGLPRTLSFSKTILGKKVGGSITIPGFARGTDYFGGGMAMVGEAGPELVSMSRGSAVITNKNLLGFMKSVRKLARIMTQGDSRSEKFSGGKIRYAVGADFQGNPKRDGVAFAANIAAGLINGLKGQQSAVNKTMAGVGTGLAESFQDILGIRSPSTVFKKYATYVAQGFIDGLVESADAVARAATFMGQAAIRGISKTVTDNQLQLEELRARSQAYLDAADELKKKSEATKSTTSKAKYDKEADILTKKSEALRETIEKLEKTVTRENTAAERADEYEKATTERRAEMRKEDAITAAADASEARERSLRLAKEASLLQKWDKARAAAISAEATAALAESKTFAEQAEAYSKEAYELSQQVQSEIDALEAAQLQTVTDIDVSNAQAAFDAYAKSLADAEAAAREDRPPSDMSFTQINNSPEAISPAEAYRHGKSLVSLAEQKLVPTP